MQSRAAERVLSDPDIAELGRRLENVESHDKADISAMLQLDGKKPEPTG